MEEKIAVRLEASDKRLIQEAVEVEMKKYEGVRVSPAAFLRAALREWATKIIASSKS